MDLFKTELSCNIKRQIVSHTLIKIMKYSKKKTKLIVEFNILGLTDVMPGYPAVEGSSHSSPGATPNPRVSTLSNLASGSLPNSPSLFGISPLPQQGNNEIYFLKKYMCSQNVTFCEKL